MYQDNHSFKQQQQQQNNTRKKYYGNSKQYDDQQENLIVKIDDSNEIKDLKSKMRVVVGKLTTVRKQKDTLHKQNESLQKQIITLHHSLRQMVVGFTNTSGSFPMPNELLQDIAQLYKCDCVDQFFDWLCPENLTMKGIIFFYRCSFYRVHQLIQNYFHPCNETIQQIGCFDTLQGPIMNVLRKAYQGTYEKILQKIATKDKIMKIVEQIKTKLNLVIKIDKQILIFLCKVTKILLCCIISDPPLQIEWNSIGQKIYYSSLQHQPFDGFIKIKQQCWIVLPSIKKIQNHQIVVKSLVLQKQYDLIN